MKLLALAKTTNAIKKDVENAHSKLITQLFIQLARHVTVFDYYSSLWHCCDYKEYWNVGERAHIFRITCTAYRHNTWLMRNVPNTNKAKRQILTLRFISKLQHNQGKLVWELRPIFYTEGYTSEMFTFPKMHKQAEIVLELPNIALTQVNQDEHLVAAIAERMCKRLVEEFFLPINFAPFLITSAYMTAHETLGRAVCNSHVTATLQHKKHILEEALSTYGLTLVDLNVFCRHEWRPPHQPALLFYDLGMTINKKEKHAESQDTYVFRAALVFAIEVTNIFIENEFKTVGAQLNLHSVSLYPIHPSVVKETKLGENEAVKAYINVNLGTYQAEAHDNIGNVLSLIIHHYTTKWIASHSDEIAKAIYDVMRICIERDKLAKPKMFTQLIKARY